MAADGDAEGEGSDQRRRALELDVREQHVEEKVNALETMKVLLSAGANNEQRLRDALDELGEQHQLEMMIMKEEADARDSLLSDQLVRAEMEIQRLSAEVRVAFPAQERQGQRDRETWAGPEKQTEAETGRRQRQSYADIHMQIDICR